MGILFAGESVAMVMDLGVWIGLWNEGCGDEDEGLEM